MVAYRDNSIFARFKTRTPQPVLDGPEPEWRENMRDMGLMLSGIYQDLRGDAGDSYGHFRRWLVGGMRKFFASRSD
ncbi:hypothetical protein [Pelagibacterium luteolum]|uniref:Uncharacterized protein n=1 Tax=Pelagibacterium luteolum TaxID=440168 RepID=A0A1G7W0B2_9HYPH|nr:hypothetical protein [Pelagibacterium luteolum]SDG65455.1 hypothetical protein SAMN04487974_105125 [Pelagibacterium luteolum]